MKTIVPHRTNEIRKQMNDIERKRRDNNNNNSNIFSRKMVSSSETSRVKMKPCFKAGLNLPGKKRFAELQYAQTSLVQISQGFALNSI